MTWNPALPLDSSKIRYSAGFIRNNWGALNTALTADLNMGIASGTKMYFYQDVAPTGWTIVDLAKDALLAVKALTTTYDLSGFSNSDPGVITLLTTDHGFTVGMSVTTASITQTGSGSSLNRSWVITAVAGANITIDMDTSTGYQTYSSGGTLSLSTSSVYSTGGSMQGTWQQPDHALTAAEMDHTNVIEPGLVASSGSGSTFRAFPRTGTIVTGAVNESTASAHNHGTTYRPYSAVGIICSRN